MQIIVYDDSFVIVYFDFGCLKIQIFGYWFMFCGYQDGVVFYSDRFFVGCICVSQCYVVGCVLYGLGMGIEVDFYFFFFECFFNGICYIMVFVGNKFIVFFEYGYFIVEVCVY